MLPTSFSTSSSSSSSASVRVDKATSDLLIGPDWTLNIEICDSINSTHWQAKDVVKAVKRRLQHKSPNVQLLSLTLLETMVKNSGEFVHFQIAEKNILQDMVKIVKKRADLRVRDKILLLLDSWQEAFGGPGGKYPQYYWAYDELRRSGIQFPQRSSDTAPIFTPPISHPIVRHPQAGYGMPSNSSRRLDEAMASESDNLSLSNLDSMCDVTELLNDMLQAVNPSDRMALKDELIVDLVGQCRSNQKKLMQMITSTGDEKLLSRGLDLNDSLQNVLAKHDAITNGVPMPSQAPSFSLQPTVQSSIPAQNEETSSSPRPNLSPPVPVSAVTGNQLEEDEEEDDFSLLARRHSKPGSISSQTTSTGTDGVSSSLVLSTTTPVAPVDPIPSPCNALALSDPPAPVKISKEQEIIDLLSITLSTTSTSPHTSPSVGPNNHQAPLSPSSQGYPYASQPHPGNQGQTLYNSYTVPWAQPHPQSPLGPQNPQYSLPQSQQPQQLQPQSQQQQVYPPFGSQYPQYSQPQPLAVSQQETQIQSQRPQYAQPAQSQQSQYTQLQQPRPEQPHPHSQPGPRYSQYPQPQAQPLQQPQIQSAYPPPPWATTPVYANNQIPLPTTTTTTQFPSQTKTTGSIASTIGGKTLQSNNSFPARGSDGSVAFQRNSQVGSNPNSNVAPAGQKPFIPSYRLFEDLDVFGSSDGRVTTGTPASLLGASGSGTVGRRK